MNEKSLLKFSLIIGVLGLVFLFYAESNLTPELRQISSLSNSDIEKNVRISGIIESISRLPSITKLKLKDNSRSINIAVFNKDNIQLEKGSKIEITGKVSLYNSALEITADKIRTIP